MNYMGEQLNFLRWMGAAVVVIGLVELVKTSKSGSYPFILWGDCLFVIAAFLWSGFTIVLKRWQIDAMQTVVMINVISVFFICLYSCCSLTMNFLNSPSSIG